MKQIEPGCLALAAWKGVSAIVTVGVPYPDNGRCRNCGQCRYWECEGLPGVFNLACECVLTRIDGHEETEEEQEAINTIQEAIGAT